MKANCDEPARSIKKAIYALVGMKHRGTEALVRSLPAGELVTLIREPMNAYDRRAVQVWAREQHVGYIAQSQNKALAARMDLAGEPAKGRLRVTGDRWPMIETEE